MRTASNAPYGVKHREEEVVEEEEVEEEVAQEEVEEEEEDHRVHLISMPHNSPLNKPKM